MIQSIFLDVGQILVAVDFNKFIQRVTLKSQKRKEDIRNYLNNSPLIKDYSLGLVKTDVFLTQLKKDLDFSGSLSNLTAAWSNIFKPIDYNIKIAYYLKPLYKIYGISNTNELHYKKISSFGVYKVFDKVFLSYVLGVSKPDKKIFKIALESTGSNPKNSVFIDDSELNVKVARKLGFISCIIRKPRELRNILRELGIDRLPKRL